MILKEIHGFDSPEHFSEFCRTIEKEIEKDELTPITVEKPYGSLMFEESWYRTAAGQVWRLVSPEFPFKGVFERVRLSGIAAPVECFSCCRRRRDSSNAAGKAYPSVTDLRTGDPILAPPSGLTKVPVADRVPWGLQERGAFIKRGTTRGTRLRLAGGRSTTSITSSRASTVERTIQANLPSGYQNIPVIEIHP